MSKMDYKLQFAHSPNGARMILYSDVVAYLYHHGHPDLAEDIIRRGEPAFEELKKMHQKNGH